MGKDRIIYDAIGRRYKLLVQGDPRPPKQVKAKKFTDELVARHFLTSLQVTGSFWPKLVHALTGRRSHNKGQHGDINQIAHFLVSGKLKFLPLVARSANKLSGSRHTIKIDTNKTVSFNAPEVLLEKPNFKAKKFSSLEEAASFIASLKLNENDLSSVTSLFTKPPQANDKSKSSSDTISKIANAAITETIYVSQSEQKSLPKPKPKPVYENVDTRPVPLSPEPGDTPIKVFPKMEAQQTIVLYNKKLHKHQDVSEQKYQPEATIIEIWVEQETSSPVFDEGGKISFTGLGEIEAFKDQQLEHAIDLNKPIPAEELAGGKKLKLWIVGKKVGKFDVKFTLSASSNGRFINQPPVKETMGVVALGLDVYEQNIPEVKKLQVDPDQEPITKYHSDLDAISMPAQIVMSEQAKIKSGRVLHLQDAGNFGRAKLVLKPVVDDDFPPGSDGCKIVLSSGGKSGSLSLFDAEFDGNEISLPHEINKAELKTEKIFWLEGAGESNSLRETHIDVGLKSPGGTLMRYGDYGRFTVIKISEVSLVVKTQTDKAEVWDRSKGRFYVNLDGTEEARKLKDRPGHREVHVRAKLTKNIQGIPIHLCLVPNKRNWDKNHWGASLTNFEYRKVERALKHTDKSNHKDLLHLSATTDAQGQVESQNLIFSRIGGDQFHLGAYLDQDIHLAKYTDGHMKLSKRKPILSSESFEIWRKFHIQNTYNRNITLPSRTMTKTSFEKCYIEISEVDEKKYDPATIAGLVSHELWQFDMSSSTQRVVCVGDVNKAKFTSLFKAPSDKTKPKAHMVMCDVQWDSDPGSSKTYQFPSNTGYINYKNAAGNDYLGVFDPPLRGGSITHPSSKWAWNDGTNWHQGTLDDTNIGIEKTRSHYSEVKVSIPTVCSAACPCGSPGTAITPTASNKASVRIKLKAATGPWAGESGSPGNPQCLIVVDSNTNKFNNTIAHEIGHLFKSVRKATNWKGIPDHPDQYERRGGQGSHCKENATPHASRVDQNGDKIYVGGTCVMYHVAVGNTVFCDNCAVDLKVRDVSDTFKD